MSSRKQIPVQDSVNYSPSVYRELLQSKGAVVSYTRGVSMLPLIKQGRNYVAVVPVVGEPQINDMLLFEQMRKGETVCILHRLIAVKEVGGEKVYITRGDNCLGCERLSRGDIIGKVDTIYRVGSSKEIKMDDPEYLEYVAKLERSWPRRRRWYRIRASFPMRALNLLVHPRRIIPAIKRRISPQ